MSKQITVKVYYVEYQKTKEIRKFSVDEELIGSFEYLIGKIRTVFPDLLRKDLELFWKDEENDYISVSSDEELVQALNANTTQTECLKFYVEDKGIRDGTTNNNANNDEVHPGVTCDGCETPIRGVRYKCLECHDFDLCSSCEKKGAHPNDHEMLQIRTPRRPSIYVTRVPPFRFAQRGQQMPWFCRRRPRNCRFDRQSGKCNQNENNCSPNQTEEKPENQIKEMISGFASAFGLDPEVAVSSMRVFLQNLSSGDVENKETDKASEESKQAENKSESTEQDGCEESIEDVLKRSMEMFGLNEQILSDVAKSLNEQLNGDVNQKEKEDIEMTNAEQIKKEESTDFRVDQKSTGTKKKVVTPPPSPKTVEKNDMDVDSSTTLKENVKEADTKSASSDAYQQVPFEEKNVQFPEAINNLASEFAKQFNSNAGQSSSSPQYADLGQLMNNIFQSYAGNGPAGNAQAAKANEGKSDDYVMVDNNKPESAEKFEQRLEKALKQMESMGFDNDGGWLRQLLISKDLSIARVLDALNP